MAFPASLVAVVMAAVVATVRHGGRLGRLRLLLLLVELLDGLDLLLGLHASVLEPDLDLSLCQAKCVCYLDAPSAGEIVVEVELLLQLQGLETCVSLPAASPWTTIGT